MACTKILTRYHILDKIYTRCCW